MGEEGRAIRLEVASVERTRGFVTAGGIGRGVAWFSVRSFWGHLQHLVASAIATEDIDSRDWMHADPPHRLADEVVKHLEPNKTTDTFGRSITAALDRDLVIDYLADTGDDPEIQAAIASVLVGEYELPDPEKEGAHLRLPRGEILMFGGDTAYPVATASEIHDRLVVPMNRALVAARDGRRRVVMAIPGNHDWYDGLDGFGRLFRKRVGELTPEQATPDLVPDRESRIGHVAEWAEKFVVGGHVQKQKVLVLDGYQPLQHASYFALPLAPGIDLLAVDRQLRNIDFRQRRYFANWRQRSPDASLFVMLPDPVYSFLEPSPSGMEAVSGLELDLAARSHFVLAGDIHHYQRRTVEGSLHVIAGGGGAFLHPARMSRDGLQPPEREWPGEATSRSLLWRIPFHIAIGKSGFIPHLALVLLFAPTLSLAASMWATQWGLVTASMTAGVFASLVCALLGGIRYKRSVRIVALAVLTAFAMGALPIFVSIVVTRALAYLGLIIGARLEAALVLVIASFTGAFTFGAYLATLTRLGLESMQAFAALAHPGFKHFLRLRVRKDGSAIDGWCIGLENPLAKGSKPVLVDKFTWRPSKL